MGAAPELRLATEENAPRRTGPRSIIVAALITATVLCASGAVSAFGTGNITELLLKDLGFRADFERRQEQRLRRFNAAVEKAGKGITGDWGATAVSPDVKDILKTELVPITEADLALHEEETERALYKDAYKLRVYFDNGDITEVSPFKKMPKRVELVEIDGIKALIVEN